MYYQLLKRTLLHGVTSAFQGQCKSTSSNSSKTLSICYVLLPYYLLKSYLNVLKYYNKVQLICLILKAAYPHNREDNITQSKRLIKTNRPQTPTATFIIFKKHCTFKSLRRGDVFSSNRKRKKRQQSTLN
jgi:hypothetical protein